MEYRMSDYYFIGQARSFAPHIAKSLNMSHPDVLISPITNGFVCLIEKDTCKESSDLGRAFV